MRLRVLGRARDLRRRAGQVRVRLTILATLLVGAVLIVAAGVLMFALYRSSGYSADIATTARARQIADVITESGVDAVPATAFGPGRHVDIVQIVDDSGQVVASGLRYPSGPLGAAVAPGEETRRHGVHPPGEDHPTYRVAFIGARTPDGRALTVEVGADETSLYSRVTLVGILSVVLIPVAAVGTALGTYWFVGRALKPVADIRERVDEISGGDLDQRVPVPDTGDEIATLAVTMNAMLDRIGAARAQQMRFVNDASHELNSPLTTLVGLLDLARTTHRPIDPDTVGTVMLPEALRLQGMVADLLLLARADEKGVPLRTEDVDLDEVVSAEVARLEALGRHTVTTHLAAARVHGDGEKLARALRNITDNASRHARTAIDVTMRVDDGEVTVIVADDGPGIPVADRERVLERFVRLDSSRERGSGGSGLGLAIVAEIVRAHGGVVTVDERVGGGAAIGFTVPIQLWDELPSPPSDASR